MNDEQIQSLWKQGKRQEPRMDVNGINRILEKPSEICDYVPLAEVKAN